MGQEAKQPGIEKPPSRLILTPGESLLLYRRALKLNQSEMAKKLGVNGEVYKRIEYDILKPPKDWQQFKKKPKLLPHERCLIYRRRSNIPQWKVAKDLGICRYWLGRMERGEVDCELLATYWNN